MFSLTGWTKSYHFLFCSISWASELLSSSTDPLSEVPPTLTLLFIDNFYHIRFTHWHYKVWGLGIKLYNNWLYSLHVMYFRFIHVTTSLQRRISFLILSSHLWHTSSLIFSLTYFNNILLFFQKHNILFLFLYYSMHYYFSIILYTLKIFKYYFKANFAYMQEYNWLL